MECYMVEEKEEVEADMEECKIMEVWEETLEVSANNNSNSSLCSSNLGMASKTLMEEQDRTCMACKEGMDSQCMVSHRCNSHTARGTEEWEILPSSLTMDKEAMDRWGEEWEVWE